MALFTSYLNTLARINSLGEQSCISWYFFNGMLFGSRDKWWGDFKFRASTHEGIDITYYSSGGKFNCFTPLIQVPAVQNARIVNI